MLFTLLLIILPIILISFVGIAIFCFQSRHVFILPYTTHNLLIPKIADEQVRLYNPSISLYQNQPTYSFRSSSKGLGSIMNHIKQGGISRNVGKSHHIITSPHFKDFVIPANESDHYTEEDGRLVYVENTNTFILFVTRNFYGKRPNVMGFIKFEPHQQKILSSGELTFKDSHLHPQKNWAPYVDGDDILLVQYINPLQIFKFSPRNHNLKLWSSQNICDIPFKLRGGTHLIKIENTLFGIGHTKSFSKGFRHVIYLIDYNTKKLISYSDEFVFDKSNFKIDVPPIIEFASGMIILDTHFVRITFGVWNQTCHYIDVPNDVIINLGKKNIL